MTLREYIRDHQGEIIKVGANHGTNFFYAAQIQEWTESWFERVSETVYHKSYNYYKNSRTGKGFQVREVLPHWIPLLNRQVVETFKASPAAEDDDVTVVMIDGVELGSVWTTKEWKDV